MTVSPRNSPRERSPTITENKSIEGQTYIDPKFETTKYFLTHYSNIDTHPTPRKKSIKSRHTRSNHKDVVEIVRNHEQNNDIAGWKSNNLAPNQLLFPEDDEQYQVSQ